MKRGSFCWVNLEPASPPEMGKTRPALVVSNTEQNSRLPSVVVIPISSRPPEIWPLRIRCALPNGKESFLVIPGIRQVHKGRLQENISLAGDPLLDQVFEALASYLSD